MRFSTLIVAAISMATAALADTHYACACTNWKSGQNVYNADATKKSCESYQARNTGSKYWESCPDCQLRENDVPHCYTAAGSLGGKEMKEYCVANGATDSLCD